MISGFLLFNLLAISVWCFLMPDAARTRFGRGLGGYVIMAGLFQGWDMFAPEPMSVNSYLEAEIAYRDGDTRVWRFPRTQDVGYGERYFRERYRKWATERLRFDDNAFLWPDAARYIARLTARPGDPPATVRLVRYWSKVTLPGAQPDPWHRAVFFTYDVTPDDLR